MPHQDPGRDICVGKSLDDNPTKLARGAGYGHDAAGCADVQEQEHGIKVAPSHHPEGVMMRGCMDAWLRRFSTVGSQVVFVCAFFPVKTVRAPW